MPARCQGCLRTVGAARRRPRTPRLRSKAVREIAAASASVTTNMARACGRRVEHQQADSVTFSDAVTVCGHSAKNSCQNCGLANKAQKRLPHARCLRTTKSRRRFGKRGDRSPRKKVPENLGNMCRPGGPVLHSDSWLRRGPRHGGSQQLAAMHRSGLDSITARLTNQQGQCQPTSGSLDRPRRRSNHGRSETRSQWIRGIYSITSGQPCGRIGWPRPGSRSGATNPGSIR